MEYLPIGTISEATLREEDLIPTFLDALRGVAKEEAEKIEKSYPRIMEDFEECEGDCNFPEDLQEEAGYMLEELENALDGYTPPYTYFGAHEGDGSLFGVWPSREAIEEAQAAGVLVSVSSLPSYILETNDHGNMSCYSVEYKPVWEYV